MHGTQKICCLRQDPTPADQMQDLFLLMWNEEAVVAGESGSYSLVCLLT